MPAWIWLIIYPTQQKIFSLLHIKYITKSTLMIMFMISGCCEGHWYDNRHVVMYSDPGLRVNIKYPLYPAPAVRTMASLDTWHVTRVTLPFVSHDGSIQLRWSGPIIMTFSEKYLFSNKWSKFLFSPIFRVLCLCYALISTEQVAIQIL